MAACANFGPGSLVAKHSRVQTMKKTDPVIDTLIDNLFAVMSARAPRRPSLVVPKVPDGERTILQFAKMRRRWRKREPIPRDTDAFAEILKQNGVYVFTVGPSHIECQAAQAKIARALGS
jgi:hypothetical protein